VPGTYFNKDGIALNGYDLVGLYNERRVAKGSTLHSFHFGDVQWLFENPGHLKEFQSDPEKYIPAYGGFCAYGASQGYKAPTQIHDNTIVDGKLYLNFSSYIRRFWLEHKEKLISTADENWPQVESTEPIRVTFTQIWIKYQFYKLFRIPYFPKIES